MLQSLAIQRFKSIDRAEVSGLASLNIIVGKSASGKTALLEAIRTGLSGLPASLWNSSSTRGGFLPIPQQPSPDTFEAMWRPFFYDFDTDKHIIIKMVDNFGRAANVDCFIDRDVSISVPVVMMPGTPVYAPASINPFVMLRVSFNGDTSRLSAYQNQHQGLFFEPGPELASSSELIASTIPINFHQVANWFSALSIDDKEHDIVETICSAFPNIGGVSVQSIQGVPQLYATLRSQNRKLPITSVSSGINKFISILIAMKVYAGGVVLVDEIENGIYFEMLPLLWSTINAFAAKTNTQVFATTHSWECLTAAARALEKTNERLSLIRVSQKEGRTSLSLSSGRDAKNAILGDIEVRQ